ncbi:MAG TPA: polysaccharide biosynthesis/export family protein [Terriglobales bacterium]|nr:polysaccharide biosynthesis/export family protein [Terriglobales bacterium]
MKRTTLILIAITLLAGSLALAQSSSSAKAPAPAPAGSSPATSNPSYVIGPDDVLYVNVWQEKDLTNTLPVRADGMISLPLLNDVQAAGLTPMQLAASITEKLKKYVADPHVTVTVTQMNSQRIYVMGEVLHPGAMNLLPDMRVLQALASAGFTQFANTKGIYLLRTENGTQTKIPINYKKILKGEATDQNLALKPGDTVVVP